MKKQLFPAILLAVLCCSGKLSAQSGYHLQQNFPVASPGGWDYPAVDPLSNRLYLSHGMQVNILDKHTGDSLGLIAGTQGIHGIAFVQALGKGYTSNGRSNSVTVFDLKKGTVLGQIQTGKNPDWILYDPFSRKIITSNHSGGDISIIDPATDRVVSSLAIGGSKLETIVSDHAGKIYINLEDKNQVAEVDIQKNAVLHFWTLEGAEGPTGLAIDTKSKRLFIACDKQLVVMNSENGKIVTKLPIGDGCDGAVFDPSTQLVFTANGEGTVTVIQEINADQCKVIETIPTKSGARTIALDEQTHRLYLPTADFEPVAADAPKGTRPRMIPGSFQVLVLSK